MVGWVRVAGHGQSMAGVAGTWVSLELTVLPGWRGPRAHRQRLPLFAVMLRLFLCQSPGNRLHPASLLPDSARSPLASARQSSILLGGEAGAREGTSCKPRGNEQSHPLQLPGPHAVGNSFSGVKGTSKEAPCSQPCIPVALLMLAWEVWMLLLLWEGCLDIHDIHPSLSNVLG